MLSKKLFALVAILTLSFSASIQAQDKPELVSPLGVKFYALPDEKNSVAEAEKKLAADPKNIDLIIELGRAQATIWKYNDAIATYTRGIEIDPQQAMLYRHRGHRYISTRQFDKAVKDMERASKLNDKNFDIWYHLALAHYLKGEFAKAAEAYEKCRAVAADDDSIIAVSDWLYMTYRRQKKEAEAQRVLERITPNMNVKENKSYYDRLLMYKGLKKESDIVHDKLTDLEIATVGYGIGNWHLYNGNKEKAREYFQRIVSGKYWPAFGFIAAETELTRMK
jgi:tetratricopeptide (TPR) repeat protein